MSTVTTLRIAAAVALLGTALGARAEDPCAGFVWDVGHERALFGGPAQALKAAADPAAAPEVRADQLYELELVAHAQVSFAATPGKKMLNDGGFAGLVRLSVASAGLYRVSADQPFWIDVADHGALISSKDFQGRAGCNAPHKVVQYELPASVPLILQFSGGTSTRVRVAVTRAPAPAPTPAAVPAK